MGVRILHDSEQRELTTPLYVTIARALEINVEQHMRGEITSDVRLETATALYEYARKHGILQDVQNIAYTRHIKGPFRPGVFNPDITSISEQWFIDHPQADSKAH